MNQQFMHIKFCRNYLVNSLRTCVINIDEVSFPFKSHKQWCNHKKIQDICNGHRVDPGSIHHSFIGETLGEGGGLLLKMQHAHGVKHPYSTKLLVTNIP